MSDLARPDCATRDTSINTLTTRIAEIAATLGADPVQDTEADLATISASLAATAKIEDALRRVTVGAAADYERIVELEAENARLRLEGGETSASIAKWQTETFGPATASMDRLYRSWDAMDVAWAAVRDADLTISRPNLSRAIRAAEELAELIVMLVADDSDPKATREVADIDIVLRGIDAFHGVERSDQVNAKMAVNRGRTWIMTGDGHGQHVEEKS